MQRKEREMGEISINGVESKTHRASGHPANWEWPNLIPAEQWAVYKLAIDSMNRKKIPFMLGGAFGLARYTGRWRNTKDIDFFILPENREAAIAGLTKEGFSDYYEKLAYDRGWIYRATKEDVIVDLIWGTPNRRSTVEQYWLEHATELKIRGEILKVLPAEELLWIKLYVLQRDRCDWPDILNLLYATAAGMDWGRLVKDLGDDLPLLGAALLVFSWVCPALAQFISPDLAAQFNIPRGLSSQCGVEINGRVQLLDSRPWFASLQPFDKPMQL